MHFLQLSEMKLEISMVAENTLSMHFLQLRKETPKIKLSEKCIKNELILTLNVIGGHLSQRTPIVAYFAFLHHELAVIN